MCVWGGGGGMIMNVCLCVPPGLLPPQEPASSCPYISSWRVLPPDNRLHLSVTFNGVTYTGACAPQPQLNAILGPPQVQGAGAAVCGVLLLGERGGTAGRVGCWGTLGSWEGGVLEDPREAGRVGCWGTLGKLGGRGAGGP